MQLRAMTGWPVPLAAPGVQVQVMLLGVRVTAYANIHSAEHRRRDAAGLGAVIDPALLERLMDLPAGIAVTDPVLWAELADQPRGVVELGEGSADVTRRLAPPLTITDVVVSAVTGKELRAVQDASLFAGFARRWIVGTPPGSAMLEAKLCGVGVIDRRGGEVLAAEQPAGLTRDGWSWLLEEKAYRGWLTGRTGSRARESPARATDESSGAGAG